MPMLFELKQERQVALNANEAILQRAEKDGGRNLTAEEASLFQANMQEVDRLTPRIASIESKNTFLTPFTNGLSASGFSGPSSVATQIGNAALTHEDPRASAFRASFAGWVSNALTAIGGGTPAMEASPSGVVSVGSGTGLDSIAITVPTEILQYLPTYFALDSFGLAGATVFYTDHTRPLTKPVMSAGAADSVYAENAAPGTSQPFGLSGFTFGGVKYARLVLATYESLMNSELPLQGAILDELRASLATTLTAATTTAFVSALTAASSSLSIGVGGSGGSIYTSIIDLRHAVPPRFDLPTNCFMLSRATLAQIRNTRASTSGVPMFSPDGTQLLDRRYVINDNLDTAAGAGVGFVAFGSFADGCYLRRTPVQTRVFQELFANSGQIGFRTQQWADQHFLAELASAAQPPSFQPIYYTNIVSES